MYPRVFCSRWYFSSSFSSRSTSSRRNSDRSRSGTVNSQCSGRISNLRFAPRGSRLIKVDNPRNRARKPAPVVCLFFELSPPILGRFPLGCDPTLLLQLVQIRVQRSIAHLQYVPRHLL